MHGVCGAHYVSGHFMVKSTFSALHGLGVHSNHLKAVRMAVFVLFTSSVLWKGMGGQKQTEGKV